MTNSNVISLRQHCSRAGLRIAVIGATGRVGSRVVELILSRTQEWCAAGVDARLVFVANSRGCRHDEAGLTSSALDVLDGGQAIWNSITISDETTVLVDCTASPPIAARYPEWLARGVHVVTPNKFASSADSDLRSRIAIAQAQSGAELRDSTTVGAQLPLLSVLRDLRCAGDRIERLEAVLSGTLSYVLGKVQDGQSLSHSIGEAVALGYAEPDPSSDLSGEDATRKLVILLRAAGIDLDVADVERVPLLDVGNGAWTDEARRVDALWRARAALAEARHEKWIYRAIFENGHARIAPERVPLDHPLAKLAPCENAIVLHSELYRVAPLTIAGPGAGIALTAAGVFADVLALAPRARVAIQIASVSRTAAHALSAEALLAT